MTGTKPSGSDGVTGLDLVDDDLLGKIGGGLAFEKVLPKEAMAELASVKDAEGVKSILAKFGKDLNLWCVAANVTDEMPDCIPVLISANFDPELLPSKWDGSSNRKLTIDPAHGAAMSPWGDEMIVVIRKGGSTQVIKAKDLSYKSLFGEEAFDLTNADPPVVYLTPKGIATPAAR